MSAVTCSNIITGDFEPVVSR